MPELTDRFIDALHQLHTDRNVDPLVALFSDDATLAKLGDHNVAHGPEGARTFWLDYRNVFDDISATFSHTISDQQAVALEWVSEGSLTGGHAFSYAGVSLFDSDDAGDQITSFRTYYDSAAFVGEAAL